MLYTGKINLPLFAEQLYGPLRLNVYAGEEKKTENHIHPPLMQIYR